MWEIGWQSVTEVSMQLANKIIPCLWFDSQAEEAARFYAEVFPDSRITAVSHYSETVHDKPAGSVLTVSFELAGQAFTALNGGPFFKFSEAVSLQIMCDTAAEVDHFWSKLGEGGPVEAQQCGWLKDRFGLSWQVVPKRFIQMMSDPDKAKVGRVFHAMMKMKKLELPVLEDAFNAA
jgi:predicted 3-demethylubiquinone-9 3-methyltransferase (glyoxalase superfamily)